MTCILHKSYILATAPVVEEDPCDPNPCGPNSNPPRVIGDRCQCSCLPEMIGSPPNCRPECVINQDCPIDKACINRKCQDPCPGLCGINAQCNVRNHVPICICNKGFSGDPFVQCNRRTTASSTLHLCMIAYFSPKKEKMQYLSCEGCQQSKQYDIWHYLEKTNFHE